MFQRTPTPLQSTANQGLRKSTGRSLEKADDFRLFFHLDRICLTQRSFMRYKIALMVAWPSGKAEACKASIPSSNLGAT